VTPVGTCSEIPTLSILWIGPGSCSEAQLAPPSSEATVFAVLDASRRSELRSSRARVDHVRVREVGALEQQRCAQIRGEGVAEDVAEIESCRVPAAAADMCTVSASAIVARSSRASGPWRRMAIHTEESTTSIVWQPALVEQQLVGALGHLGLREPFRAVAADGEGPFDEPSLLLRASARGGVLLAQPAVAQRFDHHLGHRSAGGCGELFGEAMRFGVLDVEAHGDQSA
jgi:hypothetical protein